MNVKVLAGRAKTWVVKLFMCHIMGSHDWTSAAAQGIKPTKEQLDGGVVGFWDYAKMYCGRCEQVSALSLESIYKAATSTLQPPKEDDHGRA